jgi:hypothetical protein
MGCHSPFGGDAFKSYRAHPVYQILILPTAAPWRFGIPITPNFIPTASASN